MEYCHNSRKGVGESVKGQNTNSKKYIHIPKS